MKLLLLTTRTTFVKGWALKAAANADLGADLEIQVLTLYPPTVLPRVKRCYAVAAPGLDDGEFAECPVVGHAPQRGLFDRLFNRRPNLLTAPVIGETEPNSAPAQLFAEVCGTSQLAAEAAAWADVVIATDPASLAGAYRLAKRVPQTPAVARPRHARSALLGRGHEIPELDDQVPADSMTVRTAEGDGGPWHSSSVEMPPIAPVGSRLLIAPANYAGQAYAWARAVDRHVPGAAAQNFKSHHTSFAYTSDLEVSREVFAADLLWRQEWRKFVTGTYTHVMIESSQPVLGAGQARGIDHARQLQRAGLSVGLLSHGTDVRIPSVHKAEERWAHYDALDPRVVARMEANARFNTQMMAEFDGPTFVSTPGLLRFVPGAQLLPLSIDVDHWATDQPALERDRLVVLFMPSSAQKGAEHIDPVLQRLDAEGVISYARPDRVPHAQMAQRYAASDVVIDQIGTADYGVAACEAMASGRVVVSHVAQRTRDEVLKRTGLPLPIVQADPETLEDVLRGIHEDRVSARRHAEQGIEFVRQVHDGRAAAEVLRPWLIG